MKQCIVFLGKTGSGKDTQAELLAQKYDVEIIRTGDLVREEAKTNASVAAELESGALADNALVDRLMSKAIGRLGTNTTFVSDGYPRHIEQAHKLEDILTSNEAEFALVVYFKISDAEVQLRLKLRGRSDDSPDAVLKKLQAFHANTEEVIAYFRSTKPFVEIDASKSPEEIASVVQEQLIIKNVLPKTI
jgi:adenylate kinase